MVGVECMRVVRPFERVGLYVPGGNAPLVSTTLMLAIPAQIANCAKIMLCTPCNDDGEVNPYILYAASLWASKTYSKSEVPKRLRPWPMARKPYPNAIKSLVLAMRT